ncbi:SMP-30/gluconolactonase/LRE family protein [Rheinheimera texasensis]|uniref:SMP-30/gluconolactonase/LRE family protein n=1 Tax=Rheinheimera texasensis TaxID=306205 RepID=UPI0032B1E5C4
MNSVTTRLLQRIPVQNVLGENALWHPLLQRFYWVDIEAGLLHWLSADLHQVHQLALPERIGSFGVLNVGADAPYQLVLALESGFALFHPHTGALRWLAKPERHIRGNRFNDGRTDRQGRFWAGTMVETPSQPAQAGALYQLNRQGQAVCHLRHIQISNGLCWSLDGRRMYHADSPRHQIWQYEFGSEPASLSQPRLFAEFADNASPDGATVDAEDHVWTALWGTSTVVRLDPQGQVCLTLTLPVSQPSSVALGGEHGDLLFVTTSRLGLDARQLAEQPAAGDVFIYQLSRPLAVAESLCHFEPDWLAEPVCHDMPVL